ncbi:hypothetical protein FRC09_007404 [Ceratobasidium sp. 395]|nr:hypothetical protein FRC09_007404 [Ceratobasidium sp. 395]
MWSLRFVGLALAAVQAAVATSFGAHVLKERLAEVPRGWTFHSKAPAEYPLRLRIALPQSNFDQLERELYEVSDPNHARYGKHLSPEEVNALVAPHDSSLASVDEWLKSHGFEPSTLERSPARDWVTIILPVSKAEEMLGTEYSIWEHAGSGEKIVRTMEYSVPETVHAHVHLITPTTMFGGPRPHKATFHYESDPRSKAAVAVPDASVTAVGGTHFVPEVAVAFSGGGFSNYFERPIYQAIDVPLYLKKLGGTYNDLYNPKGRAYPDIAAQGSHFRVIVGGTDYSIGGTSASAPTVAGIVALLNDARLVKGLPPLGFLNPWLYTLGRFGLNDITQGNNPGCNTPGFNATAGWDPVTGLGTPDFGKLKKIVAPF